MSNQLEMEFRAPSPEDYREAQIQAQWRKNAAEQAAYWSDERRAVLWAYGHADVTVLDALPNYERRALLIDWECERHHADAFNMPMRPWRAVNAEHERDFQQEKAMATRWAVEIRQAFAERRPCPFRPAEHATPLDLLRFQGLLQMAIDIAQIPAECLAMEPDEEKRTVKA